MIYIVLAIFFHSISANEQLLAENENDLIWLPNEIIPRIALQNGAVEGTLMPIIGAGTASVALGNETMWTNQTAFEYISQFIKLGVRRIDCAIIYPSQQGVGLAINNAINTGLVTRDEMFITSKVSDNQYPLGYNDTINQTNIILKTLNLTYLDLLLIHVPDPNFDANPSSDPNCRLNCTYNTPTGSCLTPRPINPPLCRQSTWNAMIKLFKDGKTRAIGVSNFVQHHIEDILSMNNITSDYYPSVVQNEYHIYYHDDSIRIFCQNKNIDYQGWAPLGDPLWSPQQHGLNYTSLNHPVIIQIAKKYNVTTAQINLKWILQHNMTINPLTSQIEHMKQDLDLFSFGMLTNDELNAISNIQPNASDTWYTVWPNTKNLP